jgi:hypothetical protein
VPRIVRLLPVIRQWRITQLDYRDLPNIEATWFVDPPYSGSYRRRYRTHLEPHEYNELADWCRSRHGEVIVCEAVGAAWLPFVPFTKGRGQRLKAANEAIWVQSRFYGQLREALARLEDAGKPSSGDLKRAPRA